MKYFAFLAALLIPAAALLAAPVTLIVTDLQVSSANPKYQYLGKGLAEVISFELAKARSVTLVEREKRNQVLEELEFSLSDLADPGRQAEVGKLLAARYMVFGELVDMDRSLLVSLRLIDVESGEVVWRDQQDDALANYQRIAARFARSLLTALQVEAAGTTVRAAEAPVAGREEAAVALSNAIDSYDRKDARSARKELEQARKLDPANRVVALYLQKLAPTSPKYKVQLEAFGPSVNPAVLGVIRQDREYVFVSIPADIAEETLRPVGNGFQAGDSYTLGRGGIEVPLGDSLGLGLEFVFSTMKHEVATPGWAFTTYYGGTGPGFQDLERGIGGVVSLGFRPADSVSVGAGLHIYRNAYLALQEELVYATANTALDLGFLVRNPDNTLVFDTHAVYTFQDQYYLDQATQEVKTDGVPMLVESTLTSAFLGRTLFGVLKGLGDFYFQTRRGIVLRAIPAVEYWPWRFLSLRAGYQFTYLDIDGGSAAGHGAMGGLTLRVGSFDLDFNFTSRYQPVRGLPGYGRNENFLLIGLTKNGAFASR